MEKIARALQTTKGRRSLCAENLPLKIIDEVAAKDLPSSSIKNKHENNV